MPERSRPPEAALPESERRFKPGKQEAEQGRERAREAIDAWLEEYLDQTSKYENEGSNGVILKADLRDAPEEVQKALGVFGVDLEDEQVMKVLKVYNKGRGRHEFDMQARAKAIIDESGRQDVASVPEPLYYSDIKLSDDLKERLGATAEGFKASDRIEVFLMDEVQGDDLATALYREVVRRHERTAHLAREVDELDFNTLRDEVSRAMNFALPGGKSRSEGARAFESEKVANENMEAMIGWLSRQDFQIHPDIVATIKQTMELFHDNGFVFRDAHPRNFMVEGGISAKAAEAPKTFVIDFGMAKTFEGDYKEMKEKLFIEDGGARRYPQDEMTHIILEPLAKPLEKRRSADVDEYGKELDSLGKRIAKSQNSTQQAFMKRLPGVINAEVTPEQAELTVLSSPGKSNVDMFLGPLLHEIRTGGVDAAKAKAFLQQLQKGKVLPTDQRVKVARMIELLG